MRDSRSKIEKRSKKGEGKYEIKKKGLGKKLRVRKTRGQKNKRKGEKTTSTEQQKSEKYEDKRQQKDNKIWKGLGMNKEEEGKKYKRKITKSITN